MTGLVPKLPTLVTSGFFMMAAVVFLGIGLMLDTEVKNSRKNFEIQMNIIRMMLKNRFLWPWKVTDFLLSLNSRKARPCLIL